MHLRWCLENVYHFVRPWCVYNNNIRRQTWTIYRCIHLGVNADLALT